MNGGSRVRIDLSSVEETKKEVQEIVGTGHC